MEYELRYFDDNFEPNTGLSSALPSAHRLIYVFAGSAAIERNEVIAGQGIYAHDETKITAGAKGARLFRWDLVKAGTKDCLAQGRGISSRVRMSRETWSLDIQGGSRWLFRLDMINNPPGVIADVHTHPGPGIRVLLSGTFSVRQPSEDGEAKHPGDPWWESGVEAIISTPSDREPSAFLRGMVLPTEYEGRHDTVRWLRKPPKGRAEWYLLIDKIVTL